VGSPSGPPRMTNFFLISFAFPAVTRF
jgi:hypothetical protein